MSERKAKRRRAAMRREEAKRREQRRRLRRRIGYGSAAVLSVVFVAIGVLAYVTADRPAPAAGTAPSATATPTAT